jgi:SAM-dependent methyltransferase
MMPDDARPHATADEAGRIRQRYARRDASGKSHLYAWHRPDVLFTQYRLRAEVARALADAGHTALSDAQCLDVGCGTGGWLRTLIEWGVQPTRVHGVDLLADRIAQARALTPGADLRVNDDGTLPYEAGSMDLISANMVFSSILDPAERGRLAAQMARVARRDGLVLIYDFRIRHPRNPDTVGIGRREVARLFPGFRHSCRSLTLAPPLQRPVARISPLLAHALESILPVLRSHLLHVLRR